MSLDCWAISNVISTTLNLKRLGFAFTYLHRHTWLKLMGLSERRADHEDKLMRTSIYVNHVCWSKETSKEKKNRKETT